MNETDDLALEPYWPNMLRFYEEALSGSGLTESARAQVTVRRDEVLRHLQNQGRHLSSPRVLPLLPARPMHLTEH
jgi:hypothetical protein